MRVALLVAAAIALGTAVHGQTSVPRQDAIAFEVASVRPVENGKLNAIGPPVDGTFRARATTVRWLVHYAYGREPLDRNPLPEGGPSWIDSDLYEINAKGPSDLTFPDARRMVLTLLRERFNLRSRIEKRELPVYSLVVAKKDGALGPGLRPSKVDCSAFSETLLRTGRFAVVQEMGTTCIQTWARDDRRRRRFHGPTVMHYLARTIQLSPEVDRPVIDRTGLAGTYDVDLVWAPAQPGPGVAGAALAVAPEDALSVFTAVQEQLGLRLESRREPVDVVVIDSVERPTPN